MSNNTELKFTHYIVPKIKAEINPKFNFKETTNVSITPKFKREIITFNPNEFGNQLSILINEEDNAPFILEITVRGVFKLDNWQDEDNKDLVTTTSTSTLFPYLRTLVSNVTNQLGMTPYVLPLLNIKELFKEEQN